MTQTNLGIINLWLKHIKDVYRLHKGEIDALETHDQQVDWLNRAERDGTGECQPGQNHHRTAGLNTGKNARICDG